MEDFRPSSEQKSLTELSRHPPAAKAWVKEWYLCRISTNEKSPRSLERLRMPGYAMRKRVQIYGEELDLTSDPMPDENSFVVEEKSRQSGRPRRLKIGSPLAPSALPAK